MMTDNSVSPSLEEVLARLGELPALPAVLSDLIASLDDESISLEQIAAKISRDQTLAGRTLRIANSPFFGFAGRIASIQDAATLMGLQTIRSIALTSALKKVTEQGNAISSDALDWFWQHALQTASAARQIAGPMRIPQEQAFVAGLLHDIGKFSISVLYPERYAAIEAYCSEHRADWHVAEEALGMPSHSAIGGAIARHWRFPEQLCEALNSYSHPTAQGSPLAQAVHVANVIANAFAATLRENIHVDHVDAASWSAAIRSPEQLRRAVSAACNAASLSAVA